METVKAETVNPVRINSKEQSLKSLFSSRLFSLELTAMWKVVLLLFCPAHQVSLTVVGHFRKHTINSNSRSFKTGKKDMASVSFL